MADPKKPAASDSGDEFQAFDSSVKDVYDASKIGKLEGLEAVRKKPGMYIGGTDERALHHCISEVLDNSIDEHLAGYGKRIEVTIHIDGSISIRDEGRGIPVDTAKGETMPAVEMVLTRCTRAASTARAAISTPAARTASARSASTPSRNGSRSRSRATARSTRWNSSVARRRRTRGHRQEQIDRHAHHLQAGPGDLPGDHRIQEALVTGRLRELAFLNPGLEIVFTDERVENSRARAFLYKDGIEEFVKKMSANKQVVHPKPVRISRVKEGAVMVNDKPQPVKIDIVFQYNDSISDQILCFTNTITNTDGGTHLAGFRSALTRAINQYGKSNELFKPKDPASPATTCARGSSRSSRCSIPTRSSSPRPR